MKGKSFARRHRTVGELVEIRVVSHSCVQDVNQAVYRQMRDTGVNLRIATPASWIDAYVHAAFNATALDGMEDVLDRLPVWGLGRQQRHIYKINAWRTLRRERPRVLIIEEEPISLACLQWASAAIALGIPFGVQVAENRDRSFPLPVRWIRAFFLKRASFVMARSATAAQLARRWGARGDVAIVPFAVPDWSPEEKPDGRPFTVGYAGRLVEEKGMWDLVKAVRVHPEWCLLLVGDGPLRHELELAGKQTKVITGRKNAAMPQVLATMDVLVLPSRATPQWSEQFGRVLLEALSCDTPVIGSDSGEIPWIVKETGGGRLFPEGDSNALTAALEELADNPELRRCLASSGKRVVNERFSVRAVAEQIVSVSNGRGLD